MSMIPMKLHWWLRSKIVDLKRFFVGALNHELPKELKDKVIRDVAKVKVKSVSQDITQEERDEVYESESEGSEDSTEDDDGEGIDEVDEEASSAASGRALQVLDKMTQQSPQKETVEDIEKVSDVTVREENEYNKGDKSSDEMDESNEEEVTVEGTLVDSGAELVKEVVGAKGEEGTAVLEGKVLNQVLNPQGVYDGAGKGEHRGIIRDISKGEVKTRVKVGTTVDTPSEVVSIMLTSGELTQHNVLGQEKKDACGRKKDQDENLVTKETSIFGNHKANFE
ncbi:hypothetical protein U1Q18_037156 [Sarracenia purpurea var. burkii]